MPSDFGEESGAFFGLFSYGYFSFGFTEPVHSLNIILVLTAVDHPIGPPYPSTSYA